MNVSKIEFTSNKPLINPFLPVNQAKNFEYNISEKQVSKKIRIGVFVSTMIGTGIALAGILKAKGFSFKPSVIKKTPLKECGLVKAKYQEKEILALAVGSVSGGLIGGAVFDDKKNLKAKYREAIIQMLGNIATPLACVSGSVRLYEAKLKPILAKVLPKTKKPLFNNAIKGFPTLVVSVGSLLVGIIVGNKVSNLINEKIFKIRDNRKVKLKDFSAHIDDACLAVSLVTMNNENILSKSVSRIIPAALLVAGYSTGTTQEKGIKLK